MRPVRKKSPGEVLQTEKGEIIIQELYNPYSNAQPILEENLGHFCSYCEVFDSDLQLEHVIPQNQNNRLTNQWDNFLLSCGICNGRGNKGDKRIDFNQMYFPHRDNTFTAFCYLEGGLVTVNPALHESEQSKARKTLDVLGLDKHPNNGKYEQHHPRDKRWQHRRQAWEDAQDCLSEFESGETTIPKVVKSAFLRGFFSVWVTVFRHHSEIISALISAFAGTNADYFQDDFNSEK